MKHTEHAYFAGLFDGEGCIVISKQKVKSIRLKARANYSLYVSIEMTNEAVVALFHSRFGGSFYSRQRKNYKGSFIWRVYGRDAAEFLKTIYPFLKVKQGEAEIAIRFIQIKRLHRRSWTSPQELVLQEAEAVALKAMRGKNGAITRDAVQS
jgi:hypothetical protein